MKNTVMFNRKTGQLGLKICLGDAGFKDKNWGDGKTEWGSNYAIFILDPVMFTWNYKTRVRGNSGWTTLPKDDPRVQFMALFDAIDSAEWEINCTGSEDTEIIVDEQYIKNQHDVFEQIRKIFEK